MKTEKSTRELAMKWWDNLTSFQRSYFKDLHLESTRSLLSLTGREIEQIYHNEVIEPKLQESWQESQVNQKYDYTKLPMNPNPNLPNWMNGKLNQKQFKEFNPELFKAYIEKFSDEDKIKAFNILISFEKVRWYMIEELSK
jgi:hypothetical protein